MVLVGRYTSIDGYWMEFKLDNGFIMERSLNCAWRQSKYSSLSAIHAMYTNAGFTFTPMDESKQSFIEATQEQMNKLYKQISESPVVLAKYQYTADATKAYCNCGITELLRYGCKCGGV